jgi:hypothetical protein
MDQDYNYFEINITHSLTVGYAISGEFFKPKVFIEYNRRV